MSELFKKIKEKLISVQTIVEFRIQNMKKLWSSIKSFLNSTFFQTFAIIVVGFLAYNVSIKQNDLSKQIANFSYSPKYSEPLEFSTFESDIRIKNVSKVSLHNVDPQFVDLYINPNTFILTGDTNTEVYDLESGGMTVIAVPNNLKVKNKTILVRICYLFNDNPLDRIDGIVNPIKLKDAPFYVAVRRFQAYREYKCSSAFIKYNNGGLPIII